jgi:ABC-type nitrate/sulfonate/bicarbonate transport system permease component
MPHPHPTTQQSLFPWFEVVATLLFAAVLELDCKQWLAVCGLLIVAAALGVGVGVPLALELRSSRLLEARLQVVRRILKEVPLVDG